MTTARRTYTTRQKLATVMAAEMVGLTQAAEQAGIPHQTVSYWMDRPEFSEVRRRAREDLMPALLAVAHLAWQSVGEALAAGTMEPRDALFAAEKATTLLQLVSGQATARTETRELTEGMDDHERDALRRVLEGAIEAAEKLEIPA